MIGTRARGYETFWYRPLQKPFAGGIYLGIASDFNGLFTPTISATVDYKSTSISEDISTLLDIAGGRFIDSIPSSKKDVKLARTRWYLPVVFGIQHRWLPALRWSVYFGAGTGSLLSAVHTKLEGAGINSVTERKIWGVAWIAQVWMSVGIDLWRGSLRFQVRMWDTLMGDPGWEQRSRSAAVLVGYSINHENHR